MDMLTDHLRRILIKICNRFEQRGSLTGVMKLGQDLDAAKREAIENFFGLAPLIYTAKNELKLSFDRLFSGKSAAEIDSRLEQIYQLIERRRPVPASEKEGAATVLIDQLQLAFPHLGLVHCSLQQGKASLERKLSRHPDEVRELYFTAAGIVDFLRKNSREITLSELGARFSANSKKLRRGELKKLVEQWLRLLRPNLPEEESVWHEFLVIRDRLTISALIFAPLIYQKNGREYDWIYQLYLAGEPALLSWFHLDGITSYRLAGGHGTEITLVSCENEAPFSQLLRESATQILLFTSGFPNRAVCRLYQHLSPLVCECRHWGDSDPAGLRIAAMLQAIHPLRLWRCDLATLMRHESKLLPLEQSQVNVGFSMLETDPEFPFATELSFAL